MITHPEKLLFPADGISKGELADYYARIAPVMLPHIAERPVTMERYPLGIEHKGFVQKDVSKGFPDWLTRVEVAKASGTLHHPLANDSRSLLWLANQNSITPHVWCSRVPALREPDVCVFDLDPERDDRAALRTAALAVRDTLAEFGLPCWLKTSGSKGFHIVVPLDRRADFDAVWRFAHGVGALLVKRSPDALTQEFIKSDRQGRIFVDTGRNAYGATFAAAYAVRPKPGAPVSAPCTWDELERDLVAPQSFRLRTMEQRVAEVGDLWAALYAGAQSLDGARARLDELLTEDDWKQSMAASTRKPKARKKP